MSLHKCTKCGVYTLKEVCPKCNGKAIPPAPAKFSIEHERKYGKYRRELMKRSKEYQNKD
ncbi:MAG: ribosome biogenesis protein [Asgard group archaeon]|nr:ribosome biogenesis protein [Asgard group archaeon]